MKIKVIKFENYKCPNRAHYNDSGADVFAAEDVIINPHTTCPIPTGLGVELPDGYDLVIQSKSGLSCKGIFCLNAIVDAGYRGEMHALVYNGTDEPYKFKAGDKVGQAVVRPVIYAEFVDSLGEERNTGKFGSTGV